MGRPLRIGVDIGGTFTDVVLTEGERIIATTKVLTTPARPADGVVRGVARLLDGRRDVAELVHATTLATNALIERRGVATGLLTTNGHRDVLHIRREGRFDLHDLGIEFPDPLVPRRLTIGVGERTLADGSIVAEPDPDELIAGAERLAELGAEAVAVCFINSYVNPANERVAIEAIRGAGLTSSMSAEVSPTMREFDRYTTTVTNEYIRKPVTTYLEALEEQLDEIGLADVPLFIMISNGGRAAVDEVKRFPVRLIESGPAAGALHASAFGREINRRELLSFDMGGTTAKICFVLDGEPTISPSFEAARLYRNLPGSGFPIRIPCIEMVEIGAGGGSIGWINELGLVKVGPESAGADPGPACYGNGGTRPTVTDANLVLGRLDAQYFLGGRMTLDVDAARRAIDEHLASPLGLTIEEAAQGILDVVDENMANATRMHAVERGIDIEGFSCLAFGGAGGLHAVSVADRLGLREVIIPPDPSVLSAQGLLSAPTTFDLVRSHPVRLDDVDWSFVREMFGGMLDSGVHQVERTGVPRDQISLDRYCEMRYVGQGFEVEVRLPDDLARPDLADEIRRRFHETYERLYGIVQDAPLEVLNWRGVIRGPAGDLPRRSVDSVSHAAADERVIHIAGQRVTATKWRRAQLGADDVVRGPAVIEEEHTTILVPAAWSATLGPLGGLLVSKDDA